MDPANYLLEGLLFAIPASFTLVAYVRIRRCLIAAETLADDVVVLLSEGGDSRVESRLEEIGGEMASEARRMIESGRQRSLPSERELRLEVRARLLPAQDGMLLALAIISFGLLFCDFDYPRSWTAFLSAESPSLTGFLVIRGAGDRSVTRITRALLGVARTAAGANC